MLELMSAPKQWEMGDGEVSEINTPWTNRARELQVKSLFCCHEYRNPSPSARPPVSCAHPRLR